VIAMKNTLKNALRVAAIAVGGGFVVGTASAVLVPEVAHADMYSGYDPDTAHYLRVLHSDNDAAVDRDLSMFSDAVLIREGHSACADFAAGWTHPQVWAGIRADLGLPRSSNVDAAVTGSAVTVWCPQYRLHPEST
jgi:hypothetical protein